MSLADRVFVVGFDHRNSSPAVVERAHEARRRAGGDLSLPPGVGGVPVQTCHRLEIYVEESTAQAAREIFRHWLVGEESWPEGLPAQIPVRAGEDVGRHLFRVAGGLESAVLGEDQILMQLRKAYRAACDAGLPGPVTHRLFHAAFRVGKKVRAQTGLAPGGRSIAGAGVIEVHRELRGLSGCSALVLGAGEMGELAARRLHKRGVSKLYVCNRSRARAEELARCVDGEVLSWEWRERMLPEVDVLVCATGADEPVIRAEALERATRERSDSRLVVVDLSVPANVEDPGRELPGLTLIDMEELGRRLEAERRRQRDALDEAAVLVESELVDWTAWVLSREQAEPVRKGVCRARRAKAAG